MRSGLVSLKPAESIGVHSTKNYEELIVVLEGKGKVSADGRKSIKIQTGTADYDPPETEHNVVNTGKKPLRYIYIVAKLNNVILLIIEIYY